MSKLSHIIEKGGLQILPKDDRDFKLGNIFGSGVILYEDFDVIEVKPKDQKNTDFCTAYATTYASSAQEGEELSPEYQFGKTKELEKSESWGANLRVACQSAVKFGSISQKEWDKKFSDRYDRELILRTAQYPKEWSKSAKNRAKRTFFDVRGVGVAFDDIRGALGQFKGKKQAIITGFDWKREYNSKNDGIIEEVKGTSVGGHAVCIIGQKKIGNKWYLKGVNSYGDKNWDNGFNYYSEDVINENCSKFGAYMLVDIEKDVAEVLNQKKWKVSMFSVLMAKILLVLKKLL